MKRRLSKNQKNVLGDHYTLDVFHPSFSHLHHVPNTDSFYEDEEEQTFEEFVDMGKRRPNSKGTGRFKLTTKRKRICCIFLIDKNDNKKSYRRQIASFIEAYLCLPVDIMEYDQNILDIDKGKVRVGNYIYDIDVVSKENEPQHKKKKPKNKVGEGNPTKMVDVFSLFDAFESLTAVPYFSVVVFLDCKLCEEGEEVCGRACGDRIACVSLLDCPTLKDVLCIGVHELMHTMGFDHCNSWKCLMNASGKDSWLFLSPVNLRKLKLFHKIPEEDYQFLVERYKNVLGVINSFHFEKSIFEREILWLKDKIRIMEELLN